MIDSNYVHQFTSTYSFSPSYADFKLNGNKYSNVVFTPFKNLIQIGGFLKLRLTEAQIPSSFYIVEDFNNSFTLDFGSGAILYTVEEGNYDAISFAAEVKRVTENECILNLTFNPVTGKYRIYTDTPFDFNAGTAFRFFGAEEGVTYDVSSGDQQLPNIVNFLGITKVRVNSPALMTQNYASSNGVNFFSEIAVTAPPFGVTYYFNDFSNQKLTQPNTMVLENIQLTLLDQDNREINFRGINWTIIFEIEVYLAKENISLADLIRNGQLLSNGFIFEEPETNDILEDGEQKEDKKTKRKKIEEPVSVQEMFEDGAFPNETEDEDDVAEENVQDEKEDEDDVAEENVQDEKELTEDRVEEEIPEENNDENEIPQNEKENGPISMEDYAFKTELNN